MKRSYPSRPSRIAAKKQTDWITSVLGIAAVSAVAALCWVSLDLYLPGSLSATPTGRSELQASERQVRFEMCGRDRHTCIVDGDTIWLDGLNLRLENYDTPEPYNDICGGAAEVALARRASQRLMDLLNDNAFTVQTSGTDRYDRVLATIRLDGTDVGDILISEGLARRWPDGDEFWCRF